MYGNANNTTTGKYDDVSPEMLDFNIALNILTTCVAIPGNLLLLVIFYKFKKLRDLNNVAITILSATDLLRSCVIMPTKIHSQVHRVDDLGPDVCRLTAVTCAFSFVFCPLMLAFIAFVRYYKIVPHKHLNMSDNLFYKICMGMFAGTVLFAMLPYMGMGNYDYSHIHGVCFVDWSRENKDFRILFYSLSFFVAFPVLAISYARLYRALRKNNRRLMQHYAKDETAPPTSRVVAFVQRLFNNRSLAHLNQKTNQDQGNQNQTQSAASNRNVSEQLQVDIGLCQTDATTKQLASLSASQSASRNDENSIGTENAGFSTTDSDIAIERVDIDVIETTRECFQQRQPLATTSTGKDNENCSECEETHEAKESEEYTGISNAAFVQEEADSKADSITEKGDYLTPRLDDGMDENQVGDQKYSDLHDPNFEINQEKQLENRNQNQDSHNGTIDKILRSQSNVNSFPREKPRIDLLARTQQAIPVPAPRSKEEFKKASLKLSKLLVRHKHENHKHDHRVTQLLVVIFIAYLFCWLPGTIVNVWAQVRIYKDHRVHPNFWFYLIVTLEEMKCALDPLIYGLGNQKYRKAFWKLTKHLRTNISDIFGRK